MKKIPALLVLSILFFKAYSSDREMKNFVVFEGATYFCDEIFIGPDNSRISCYRGKTMKMSTAKIDAYSKNGKLYEKLPILTKNLDTAGWAFMQYIASFTGYRLYRYCTNCAHYDPSTGEINPSLFFYRYYIFKGGKFYAFADDENAKAQLALFGVRRIV